MIDINPTTLTKIAQVTLLSAAAFVPCRLLGPEVGDLLDKRPASRGLAVNRYRARAALPAFVTRRSAVLRRRSRSRAHRRARRGSGI